MRQLINKLKHAIRNKYAWPGGYALILLMTDGQPICTACGKTEFGNILDSTKHQLQDGWQFADVFVNYEDLDCYCAHCSDRLLAEYED